MTVTEHNQQYRKGAPGGKEANQNRLYPSTIVEENREREKNNCWHEGGHRIRFNKFIFKFVRLKKIENKEIMSIQ